jgi:hypothetical protein
MDLHTSESKNGPWRACEHDNKRFQVLMVVSMKFRVFWAVAPCSHVETDRSFRGAYCLHHQGDKQCAKG